ncbi:hypothetical protein CLV63_101235 [Murinocardiopsis flavida]|uniref:Galactose oxidase-like protein n=1 Tax=Murinocardiopsis flavida TaxID=645275 RepID=A0A2P8DU64_9ACTN|nr:hypothetical protein [Murinocardiopsis flavida]PSL00759.1 hypothetical protein CLV63_101235 [Murinocardiopsis flavida]
MHQTGWHGRHTARVRTGAAGAFALAAVAALAAPAQAAPQWTQVHGSAELGGSFDAVAAVDGANIWAFGDDSAQNDGATWVHRWDGEKWQKEATPDGWSVVPSTADASAADDVWAAGRSPEGGASSLHFDGDKWEAIELDPALTPTDIEAIDPDNVWMLAKPVDGYDRATFFDGEIWRDYPAPAAHNALSAVSADDVFAVGGGDGGQPGVERWDGEKWTPMEVPKVDLPGGEASAVFEDVFARSADDVWAAGGVSWKDGDDVNHSRPLLAHFDGDAWSIVETEGDAAYDAVADDGDGGLWLNEGSWNPTFVHRTAGGETTRQQLTDDKYDLSIPTLAHVPGGNGAVAVGTAFEEGDPDVFTDHGVVFGTGL